MKLVILGASGNLAREKIFPALELLNIKDLEIYLYCRQCTDASFGKYLIENKENIPNLISQIKLIKGEYDDLSVLEDVVDSNTIYYLSVPAHIYIVLLQQICRFDGGKIAIEKPFGENYNDFLRINEFVNNNRKFKFYFIDHFITKQIPSQIRQILKKDTNLYEILRNEYISKAEIIVKEKITAQGRRAFDKTGVIKDMLVNHLIEYFSLFMADISDDLEKDLVDLLSKTSLSTKKTLFGQYKEYKKEMGADSSTETFALVIAQIDRERWKNIPVYIYSGKALDEKITEVKFTLKENSIVKILDLFNIKQSNSKSGILVFNIFPNNKIYLSIDGVIHTLYDGSNLELPQLTYTNYERIFYSLIKNIEFPYVNSTEIGHFWGIFDPILNMKKELIYYDSGYSFEEEIKKL